jgi:hypothetical protein
MDLCKFAKELGCTVCDRPVRLNCQKFSEYYYRDLIGGLPRFTFTPYVGQYSKTTYYIRLATSSVVNNKIFSHIATYALKHHLHVKQVLVSAAFREIISPEPIQLEFGALYVFFLTGSLKNENNKMADILDSYCAYVLQQTGHPCWVLIHTSNSNFQCLMQWTELKDL